MLGIEMMDKTSGNNGRAIINISSMSGEYTILLFVVILFNYIAVLYFSCMSKVKLPGSIIIAAEICQHIRQLAIYNTCMAWSVNIFHTS